VQIPFNVALNGCTPNHTLVNLLIHINQAEHKNYIVTCSEHVR